MLGTLLKKEFFESFKTKKFLVLPLVMIIFSTSSPFMAYYMNDIIINFGGEDMEGLIDYLTAPTMLSSFGQFLQNFNQLVYLVLIFLAITIFISDKTKGRLTLLLSKPIKCKDLLLSKFINLSIQFIIAYIISSYFFIMGTQVLFKEFDIMMFVKISSLLILYGIFLISLSMFTSVIFKSYMGSVLTTVAIFMVFGIFSSFLTSDFFFLIPGNIVNLQKQIMTNSINQTALLINLISTILISVILVIASIEIFKRQEID